MNVLNNKNIVVTGGNGFLGKVFCEAISENGGNPIILDNNIKNSDKLLNNLKKKYNNNPSVIKCDISNYVNLKKIYIKILNNYKKVHGLINNAAINPKFKNINNRSNNLLENFDNKFLLQEFNVGIIGALNCTKLFGYHFSKNKSGSIINISSDLGVIGPNQSLYNDTTDYKKVKPVSYSIIKSGIIGLTRYTSTYWSKDNVRCNTLAPGGVYDNQDKKFIKKINKLIPLKRMAKSYELKGPIIFLLSDDSSYINGQTLLVDGGRTIW